MSAEPDLVSAEVELDELNKEMAKELAKSAVDVAGIVDPTPISDCIGAALSLQDGDFVGAGLSLISVVPYVGDALGKTAKGARAAAKLAKLRDKIAASSALIQKLKATASKALKPIEKRVDDVMRGSKKMPDAKMKAAEPCPLQAKAAQEPPHVKQGKSDVEPPCLLPSVPIVTGAPVFLATGEKLLSVVDFTLPGPIPLVWERRYRSSNAQAGALGPGWVHPFSVQLRVARDAIILLDAEGRTVRFPPVAVGASHFDAFEQVRLSRSATDITLYDGNGAFRVFRTLSDRGDVHRLVAIHDRAGSQIDLLYDDREHLTGIKDSAGRQLRLDLDDAGRISTITAPVGPLAHYRYDEQGRLVAAADAHQRERTYQYDGQRLVRYTDRLGFGQRAEYSATGRCIRTVADDGTRELRFAYDPVRRTTRVTDALGHSTLYHYNARLQVTQVTDALNRQTTYRYDDAGLLVETAFPGEGVSRYTYDARANLVGIVDVLGQTAHAAQYNEMDLPLSITNAAGATWQYQYDERGNLIQETDPLGHVTRYTVDARGLPLTITNAQGGETRLNWNEGAALTTHTDCSNKTTRFAYDPFGNLAERIDALGQTTHYQFDRLGRLTALRHADGTTEKFDLDAEGRLLAYTDAAGHSTRYRYDAHGQPLHRMDAAGRAIQYEYDVLGRTSVLNNANKAAYRFRYDALHRLIGETDFAGIDTEYQLDLAGRPHQVIQSAEGQSNTVYLEHDALGRLVKKTTLDDVATFEYDPLGFLTKAINRDSTVEFHHDPLGQTVAEVQDGRTLTHAYDELGNRIRSVLPSGHVLDYLYYGCGHLHQINADGQLLCDMERDDLHREIRRSQGARTADFAYDPLGRITSYRSALQSATQRPHLIERQYRYDPTGNLLELTQRRGNDSSVRRYQYDPTGRIAADNDTRFSFDPAGNPVDSAAMLLTNDRVTVLGDCRYRYDAFGNVIEKKQGPHTTLTLSYDLSHRLGKVAVTRQAVTEESTYRYDALGRRTMKNTPAGATQFFWDGNRLLEEVSGDLASTYLYQGDSFTPLARLDRRGSGGATTALHFHTDQIGTPQEISDAAGTAVWQARYVTYGNVVKLEVETVSNSIRFPGQYFDEESGLHYNRHRYYDPHIGRFLCRDPIGLWGGLNGYEYAPNPTGWVDPLGLCKGSDGNTAAKGVGEASSLANAARLRGKLVGKEIAGGHAFEKHVLNQGEFKGLGIRTREQFASHIEDVVNNPTASRQLTGGRSAYWQESTGTVVIRNPRAVDGGTAFQPTLGRKYFDDILR